MIKILAQTEKVSAHRNTQIDFARAERDNAIFERDSARTERDDFRGQNDSHKKNNVAQEQHFATISHDLRSPVGAIKMAIGILRDTPSKEMILDMIDLIDRNADQAGELINQLLDAHLIKSGEKLPIDIVPCSLLPILEKCHQSLAPQDRDNVILIFDNPGNIAGFWDPQALERAFKNLISNAIKFSHSGKNIQIIARQRVDITSICFHNFGEVISLENQLKIFDNHYRVQSEEIKCKKGWGLGLTLVRGIAAAHNGKVEVTSSKSEGTSFILYLPNDARI